MAYNKDKPTKRYYYTLYHQPSDRFYIGYATDPNRPVKSSPNSPDEKIWLLNKGCKPIWLSTVDDTEDENAIKMLYIVWKFEIMYLVATQKEPLTDGQIQMVCESVYHKLQVARGLENE